ncbi:nuclear pore complex protein nup1 [Anaeramoeba flamelloides]|uniref:Nuclear pore complex protein nup1 n=1 Tax=Anaeramoeba flamelloides TaxID=1746091 RepID=A0ABQ8XWT8_9EUKA|nr:nuclear pore complex protein nup1 [Anaeramoeba flamelloides]
MFNDLIQKCVFEISLEGQCGCTLGSLFAKVRIKNPKFQRYIFSRCVQIGMLFSFSSCSVRERSKQKHDHVLIENKELASLDIMKNLDSLKVISPNHLRNKILWIPEFLDLAEKHLQILEIVARSRQYGISFLQITKQTGYSIGYLHNATVHLLSYNLVSKMKINIELLETNKKKNFKKKSLTFLLWHQRFCEQFNFLQTKKHYLTQGMEISQVLHHNQLEITILQILKGASLEYGLGKSELIFETLNNLSFQNHTRRIKDNVSKSLNILLQEKKIETEKIDKIDLQTKLQLSFNGRFEKKRFLLPKSPSQNVSTQVKGKIEINQKPSLNILCYPIKFQLLNHIYSKETNQVPQSEICHLFQLKNSETIRYINEFKSKKLIILKKQTIPKSIWLISPNKTIFKQLQESKNKKSLLKKDKKIKGEKKEKRKEKEKENNTVKSNEIQKLIFKYLSKNRIITSNGLFQFIKNYYRFKKKTISKIEIIKNINELQKKKKLKIFQLNQNKNEKDEKNIKYEIIYDELFLTCLNITNKEIKEKLFELSKKKKKKLLKNKIKGENKRIIRKCLISNGHLFGIGLRSLKLHYELINYILENQSPNNNNNNPDNNTNKIKKGKTIKSNYTINIEEFINNLTMKKFFQIIGYRCYINSDKLKKLYKYKINNLPKKKQAQTLCKYQQWQFWEIIYILYYFGLINFQFQNKNWDTKLIISQFSNNEKSQFDNNKIYNFLKKEDLKNYWMNLMQFYKKKIELKKEENEINKKNRKRKITEMKIENDYDYDNDNDILDEKKNVNTNKRKKVKIFPKSFLNNNIWDKYPIFNNKKKQLIKIEFQSNQKLTDNLCYNIAKKFGLTKTQIFNYYKKRSQSIMFLFGRKISFFHENQKNIHKISKKKRINNQNNRTLQNNLKNNTSDSNNVNRYNIDNTTDNDDNDNVKFKSIVFSIFDNLLKFNLKFLDDIFPFHYDSKFSNDRVFLILKLFSSISNSILRKKIVDKNLLFTNYSLLFIYNPIIYKGVNIHNQKDLRYFRYDVIIQCISIFLSRLKKFNFGKILKEIDWEIIQTVLGIDQIQIEKIIKGIWKTKKYKEKLCNLICDWRFKTKKQLIQRKNKIQIKKKKYIQFFNQNNFLYNFKKNFIIIPSFYFISLQKEKLIIPNGKHFSLNKWTNHFLNINNEQNKFSNFKSASSTTVTTTTETTPTVTSATTSTSISTSTEKLFPILKMICCIKKNNYFDKKLIYNILKPYKTHDIENLFNCWEKGKYIKQFENKDKQTYPIFRKLYWISNFEKNISKTFLKSFQFEKYLKIENRSIILKIELLNFSYDEKINIHHSIYLFYSIMFNLLINNCKIYLQNLKVNNYAVIKYFFNNSNDNYNDHNGNVNKDNNNNDNNNNNISSSSSSTNNNNNNNNNNYTNNNNDDDDNLILNDNDCCGENENDFLNFFDIPNNFQSFLKNNDLLKSQSITNLNKNQLNLINKYITKLHDNNDFKFNLQKFQNKLIKLLNLKKNKYLYFQYIEILKGLKLIGDLEFLYLFLMNNKENNHNQLFKQIPKMFLKLPQKENGNGNGNFNKKKDQNINIEFQINMKLIKHYQNKIIYILLKKPGILLSEIEDILIYLEEKEILFLVNILEKQGFLILKKIMINQNPFFTTNNQNNTNYFYYLTPQKNIYHYFRLKIFK